MASQSEADIEVLKRDFDKDPVRYMRQATPERRVVVRHRTGRISAVFGGSLDVLPDGAPVERVPRSA